MITQDEFQLLWQVANSPGFVDNGLEFYEEVLESLEKKGFVRLDRRKVKIISAMATSTGAAVLEDTQYADWIPL